MMSDSELDALGADIKKMGRLTSPIVFLFTHDAEDRVLLDGRNRVEAAERVGYAVQDHETRYWKSAHIDPYEYVISANIQRRHLTAEQKRDLIAKLLKANPGKSDRQIAETVKTSPTTVGTVRKELSNLDSCEQTETRTGSDGKTRKIPVKTAKIETNLVASIKQSLRDGDREARKAEVYEAKAASLMAKLDVQASAEARKQEAEIEADEVIAAIELRATLDEIGPAITDQIDTDANLFWCHFAESACGKMWEAGTPAHRSAFLKMLTRDARDRKAMAEHFEPEAPLQPSVEAVEPISNDYPEMPKILER
jgi:hypothetical protein